jgi:hypothetical protein
MYVKMMQQQIGVPHTEGDNDFTMFQIHKGQSIGFWQVPGQGMTLDIVEENTVKIRHPVCGPVYVMSESGKTIATYATSLKATSDLLSDLKIKGEQMNAPMVEKSRF